MQLNENEIGIITAAYRELVAGIGLSKVDVKVSYSEEEAREIIEKIKHVKAGEVDLTCEEVKLVRNLVSDLLRELDAFEFEVRMGYSLDDVFDLFKKIKRAVDSICY